MKNICNSLISSGPTPFQLSTPKGVRNPVHAFKITDITTKTYSEKMIDTPLVKSSSAGWNAEAMHHVDARQTGKGKWIGVVDALGK